MTGRCVYGREPLVACLASHQKKWDTAFVAAAVGTGDAAVVRRTVEDIEVEAPGKD